jgi:hypothetical protein
MAQVSSAAPNASAVAGDNFVFASNLGSAVTNLIQAGAGDTHLFQAALPADHVNTVPGSADTAPVEAMHPNAAVDSLASFAMHAAAHTAGHFLF